MVKQDLYLLSPCLAPLDSGRGSQKAMTDAMTRAINMHISSLRERLEASRKYPGRILTVAKVGYKFASSKNA
jgi:DNA-binding response OmpR family regulator